MNTNLWPCVNCDKVLSITLFGSTLPAKVFVCNDCLEDVQILCANEKAWRRVMAEEQERNLKAKQAEQAYERAKEEVARYEKENGIVTAPATRKRIRPTTREGRKQAALWRATSSSRQKQAKTSAALPASGPTATAKPSVLPASSQPFATAPAPASG